MCKVVTGSLSVQCRGVCKVGRSPWVALWVVSVTVAQEYIEPSISTTKLAEN